MIEAFYLTGVCFSVFASAILASLRGDAQNSFRIESVSRQDAKIARKDAKIPTAKTLSGDLIRRDLLTRARRFL